MYKIRCKQCGKLLLEAVSGEFKIICARCKELNHVVIYSNGVILLNDNHNVVVLPTQPSEFKCTEIRTMLVNDSSQEVSYLMNVNRIKRD